MRFYNLRLPIEEAITTSYGIGIPLRPLNTRGEINNSDTSFTGILSTLTVRCSSMGSSEVAITARLTEDEDGDLATMPETSCGLTRGITNDDKTTCVYKFEAQFSDDYPLYLWVKTSNGPAQLDQVILSYRQAG